MSFNTNASATRNTLLGCGIVDVKIKVIGLTHVIGEDNFTLQVED